MPAPSLGLVTAGATGSLYAHLAKKEAERQAADEREYKRQQDAIAAARQQQLLKIQGGQLGAELDRNDLARAKFQADTAEAARLRDENAMRLHEAGHAVEDLPEDQRPRARISLLTGAPIPNPPAPRNPVNWQRDTKMVNGKETDVLFNPETMQYIDANTKQPVQIAPVPKPPQAWVYAGADGPVLIDKTKKTYTEVTREGDPNDRLLRPPNQGERTALTAFQTMANAQDIMDQVEDQVSEQDLLLINNSPLPYVINNNLLSNAGQKYLQAFINFSEARLRKVSGAQIKEDEWDNEKQLYGMQYGDLPDVRTQKRNARGVAVTGVQQEAQNALNVYNQRQGRTQGQGGGAGAGGGAGYTVVTPDGKTHTFDSQEQLDLFKQRVAAAEAAARRARGGGGL